jgi:transposase InsO family protein
VQARRSILLDQLAYWLASMACPIPGASPITDDPRQDRALSSLDEKSDSIRALLLPGQLEARLAEFVAYYNTRRYHESLSNLTAADIYFGRGHAILSRRENTKLKTIELRRRLHQQSAASTSTPMGQILS